MSLELDRWPPLCLLCLLDLYKVNEALNDIHLHKSYHSMGLNGLIKPSQAGIFTSYS